MILDCLIRLEMLGSGARIGLVRIQPMLWRIRRVQRLEPNACCVVATNTTVPTFALRGVAAS